MDYRTYRIDAFNRVNSFDRTFHPWLKWQDVKLTTLRPCSTCDVHKELMERQYEVQMSGGLQEEVTKPCEYCMDSVMWQAECLEKLAWYEDHDERLEQ